MFANSVEADEPKLLAPIEGYPSEPVYEVVDGVVVKLPMSLQNDFLANQLLIELGIPVRERSLGVVVHKVLFEIPLRDRSARRRPDVAFVSYLRWPANRPIPAGFHHWPVVPDLTVDFVSSVDEIPDFMVKVQDYFDAGVRQAWVVHPRERAVQVFRTPSDVRVISEPEVIEGGDVLPGIRVSLAAMLPPRP